MDENYTSLAVLEKEMFVSALTGHCCSSRPGVIRREAPRAAPAERGRVTPCLAPCGGDGAEPEQQIHAPGFWLPLGPETFGSLSSSTRQECGAGETSGGHQVPLESQLPDSGQPVSPPERSHPSPLTANVRRQQASRRMSVNSWSSSLERT